MSGAMTEPLLRVNDLVKNFSVKGGVLRRTVEVLVSPAGKRCR